ncbi:hypothetical protein K466DRAFT_655942 [Polyporus arcularius HHB13444]|uniref:Uncharacterized protein n=1 Tax=Polyporus arcularius HHB13444 TaxID=1314778 RepID=A0A5C3NXB8_9APHY|nr:hypothetical protein K466DRAFT_655942 [Polyporus arcularius HHB13444]
MSSASRRSLHGIAPMRHMFLDLGPFRAAAKKILNSSQGAEVDEAEREYLLEYYSLVREGKTNYTATAAMLAYFGERGQEMSGFFTTYSEEFKPKKRRTIRTKASGGATTRSRG